MAWAQVEVRHKESIHMQKQGLYSNYIDYKTKNKGNKLNLKNTSKAKTGGKKTLEDVRQAILPDEGNFVLPSSQQPGPLVGFGQNIIEKGQLQLFVFADAYIGPQRQIVDGIPSILYQPTDKLSIFLNAPYALDYRFENEKSSGIEDVFSQFEYAFFDNPTKEYNEQATVVAAFYFPSGSVQKFPATGYGAMSYFLGVTYNRTYVDWLFLTSYGVLCPTRKGDIKYGNIYLYQFGIGKNICSIKSKLIFDWLIEVDGSYYEKDNFQHEIQQNTGGNYIFITPSLFLSTKNLVFQFGIGFPLAQKLYGNQKKYEYSLVGDLAWTF